MAKGLTSSAFFFSSFSLILPGFSDSYASEKWAPVYLSPCAAACRKLFGARAQAGSAKSCPLSESNPGRDTNLHSQETQIINIFGFRVERGFLLGPPTGAQDVCRRSRLESELSEGSLKGWAAKTILPPSAKAGRNSRSARIPSSLVQDFSGPRAEWNPS